MISLAPRSLDTRTIMKISDGLKINKNYDLNYRLNYKVVIELYIIL